VNVEPYDEEKVKKIERIERIKREWLEAKRKLDSIYSNFDQMEKFIDWVNENI